MRKDSWVVQVTYGNQPHKLPYARGINSREDAEKLQAAAMERGYRDAEIVSEESFREAQEARRVSKGDPKRPRRAAG